MRRSKSLYSVPALLAVWVLGASVYVEQPWAAWAFLPVTYVALPILFLAAGRAYRDWANPLSIVLALGFVRFSLPGVLVLLGADPDVPVFRSMGLDYDDWLLGHILALLGLLGFVTGWLLPATPARRASRTVLARLGIRLNRGVRYSAPIGMLVGGAALTLFVARNASIGDVVLTGAFRSAEIQVGTGVFFWLSLSLIASSVVLAAYLMSRAYAWWITLLPLMITAMMFWTLGGRVRALTPLGAGLLLLWYHRDRVKIPIKTASVLSFTLLPAILYAGQAYRGGGGLEAIPQAFTVTAVSDYLRGAIWVDLGQLHALAGAAVIGPGVLSGGTFTRLLWPLSDYLGLPGRSAGVYIVETLVGFGDGKRWGFHSTLVGDAYLNFGLTGVLVVTAAFGAVLKRFYVGLRAGAIHSAFYVLALLYAVRIFFESIEKFPETMVVLSFTFLVLRAGHAIVGISGAHAASGHVVAGGPPPMRAT